MLRNLECMKRIIFISCMLTLMLTTGCDNSWNNMCNMEENTSVSSQLESNSVDANQLDYYWYQGEKVYLKRKVTKHYVLFDAEKESVVKNVVKKTGDNAFVSQEFRLSSVKMLPEVATTKKLKWCIVNNGNAYIKDLVKTSDIEYYAPFYETIENGKEIGISHLFYVKLKKKEDKDLLVELATKLRVDILGYNEYMPQWYTLSCNVNSVGNSLQMSNAFYESGLFECAEPSFMFNMELASTSSSTFPNG